MIESKVFSVDELLFDKTLSHRNQWHWYQISGSDDLGWAALALLYAADISILVSRIHIYLTKVKIMKKG